MGLSLFFLCFCYRLVMTCFVVDLLQWVVVSSILSFFMGFHVGSSDDKV